MLNTQEIEAHYRHAREKHPYFADDLTQWASIMMAETKLDRMREALASERDCGGSVSAQLLLQCELAEMEVEIVKGDKAAAVREAYDAIAVLLRIIDVLEGRQKLGKPEEEGGAE